MIVALVPAAGASSRMGSPKLLLPFGGAGSVLASYLGVLERGGVERLLVIVAAGDDGALAREAGRAGAEVATNPAPERGMLSSLWAGLDALAGDPAEALVLGPADFPALRAGTVRDLLDTVRGGAVLAVPTVDGARGHPLVVSGELASEIRGLDLALGLRQLLDRHADELREVAVDDPGAILDVDDETSYRRALALARGAGR